MISKTYDNLDKTEFYTKFFQFYNIVVPDKKKRLKDMEIQLLSEFLSLDQAKYKITRFSNEGKNQVINRLREKLHKDIELGTINTHLTAMRKKGLLITEEDKVSYLSPFLLKLIEITNSNKEIDFKFKFKINE